MRIVRYTPLAGDIWDRFVKNSKNGTFLFDRNYMDYHSNRFADHSLLFFDDGGNDLVAVLPANEHERVMYTHRGLTFGGVVSDQRMKAATMLRLFDELLNYLDEQRIVRLVYKTIPHIYHTVPAEEDLYALFRHGAKLTRRDLSSTIWMKDRPALSKGRAWSARRGLGQGVEFRQGKDFQRFMSVARARLQEKYRREPTHTGEEMDLLAGRFPDHIKLFGGYDGDELFGGVIIYETQNVAHVQYMTATERGRELGIVDGVLSMLLNDVYANVPYFDFGISTEGEGRHLNEGLTAFKESYGARAIVYDTHEMSIG